MLIIFSRKKARFKNTANESFGNTNNKINTHRAIKKLISDKIKII